MNSKLIYTSYSILLAIAGLAMLFLGDEVTYLLRTPSSPLINSIIAALYFGFATVNWHSKNLTIGGIYGRPLLLGNIGHTTIGAISLFKIAFDTPSLLVIIIAVIYTIFLVAFTWLMYTDPTKNKN